MTLDEERQVDRLARLLWPDEVPNQNDHCASDCRFCEAEVTLWHDRKWQLYQALINAEFAI